MSAQRMILGEALSRGRIATIWLKVSSPPGWMKDNGSEKNGGHVKPEHYQDYADYLAGHSRHYRTSATENHATGPAPTPGDLTTFLTILPKSISTLVMPLASTNVARQDAAASVAFDVFPNPAGSRVTLRLDNTAGYSQMFVTDILGRVYARIHLEAMTREHLLHIETGSWPSGAYRVSLVGNSAVLSRMIILR